MSEGKALAKIVAGLSDIEFKVLEVMERISDSGRASTITHLAEMLRMDEERVREIVATLNRHKLVWAPRGAESGYYLNFRGLDALALNSAATRGILTHIGVRIGVGKEADVYTGISGEGNPVAVKFYRIGRASMKKHRRWREVSLESTNYLVSSKRTASREMEALRILYPVGVPVPAPIYRNRHMIVTSLIQGDLLVRVREHPSPERLLNEIIDSISAALRSGVIHRDLSPYNILVDLEGHHIIIDWPQWVTPDHRNAAMYLERDIRNITSYFRRAFKIQVDEERYRQLVLGLSR
jgi:RIO kinase 2